MINQIVLIDSCVLAAFILERDPHHSEAEKIIRYLFNNERQIKFLLAPLILYETGVVVVRSGVVEAVVRYRLNKLLSDERQQQVRTQDMYLLNTAIDFSAPLISFDQSLLAVCRRLDHPAFSIYQELVTHQL